MGKKYLPALIHKPFVLNSLRSAGKVSTGRQHALNSNQRFLAQFTIEPYQDGAQVSGPNMLRRSLRTRVFWTILFFAAGVSMGQSGQTASRVHSCGPGQGG